MGSKPTKVEGSYLPSTPITQCGSPQSIMKLNEENTSLDPRSPAESRTPIYLKKKLIGTNVPLISADLPERGLNNEKTLDVLRKRFLKSCSYNLNDPRSPSLNFNRTPLAFEETFEKSLNLDDTFTDLFVESRPPYVLNKIEQTETAKVNCHQDVDALMIEEKIIKNIEDPMAASNTPVVLQQEFDPRSPSIGVERTPIIFTDDEVDETNEDIMLESILATLSLNLDTSVDSSIVSMIPQRVNVNLDLNAVTKPTNKNLDRVRVEKKSSLKVKRRMQKRRPSQQQIYEDQENRISMTPKLKLYQADKNDSLKCKRTPLSCVRNRNGTHFRSRSVESSAKSVKKRLALRSFDDTFNIENQEVPNLRISQQCSVESIEL